MALQLVRFNAVALVPGTLLLLWWPRRSLRGVALAAGVFVVGAVLTALALPVRAVAVDYLVFGTSLYPGVSLQGSLDEVSLRSVLAHPSAFLAKWYSNLVTTFYAIPNSANPYVAGAALWSALVLASRPSWRPAVLSVALALLGIVLLTGFTQTAARLYLPFAPFAVTFVVAAGGTVLASRRVALSLLALIVVLPFLADVEVARHGREAREARAADLRAVVERLHASTGATDWVASDVHEVMAWEADRPMLRIPNDRATLAAVEQRYRPVDFVLLTTIRTGERGFLPDASWSTALETGELQGYAPVWLYEGRTLSARLFHRTGREP